MAPPKAAATVADSAAGSKSKQGPTVRPRRSPRKSTTPAAKTTQRMVAADAEQTAEAIPEATARPIAQKTQQAVEKRDGIVTELSDVWFEAARGGQVATLDALRKFVDVVVPLQGGDDSRRRKLIDGAFRLADSAGKAQLGLARGALQNSMLVYFDVDVGVTVDTEAFTGVDVDVTVPTNVKTLSAA